jgi:hypothetical protein
MTFQRFVFPYIHAQGVLRKPYSTFGVLVHSCDSYTPSAGLLRNAEFIITGLCTCNHKSGTFLGNVSVHLHVYSVSKTRRQNKTNSKVPKILIIYLNM